MHKQFGYYIKANTEKIEYKRYRIFLNLNNQIPIPISIRNPFTKKVKVKTSNPNKMFFFK